MDQEQIRADGTKGEVIGARYNQQMSHVLIFVCMYMLQYSQFLVIKISQQHMTQLQGSLHLSQILVIFLFFQFSYSTVNRINPSGRFQGDVAGIILSFHRGASYDNLFSNIKQQSKQGSVVLTYVANSQAQRNILDALSGKYLNADNNLRQFVGQVQKMSEKCPSCVAFNWECSSGYSDEDFNNDGITFELLKMIIKRGYFAMFSDFSLKALIKQWDDKVLGPNPFEKVGETSTTIKMKFDKKTLLDCPSSQLQAVAQLSQTDELSVRVLGGTIMYGVNSRREKTNIYDLEVLTIASNFPAPHAHLQSEINGSKGLASHVLLSYPKGGKILTSMGHWIELMKIDTSKQKLYETTQNLFGRDAAMIIMDEYQDIKSEEEKKEYLSKKSKLYVQGQHPGSNKIYLEEKINKNKKTATDL